MFVNVEEIGISYRKFLLKIIFNQSVEILKHTIKKYQIYSHIFEERRKRFKSVKEDF